MKFLIFALCVCAASAASFGGNKPYRPTPYQPTPYQPTPYQPTVAKAFAQTVVPSFASVPAAVATAPVAAAKAVYTASQAVVSAPVAAAKTVYNLGKDGEAAILRSDSEVNADGFQYRYETENGISAEASGVAKKVDNIDTLYVVGSYKYVAPDGTPVQFSYVADENGYQPQSDLLPVGPPIPEDIARSLEYIRTHPAKAENY